MSRATKHRDRLAELDEAAAKARRTVRETEAQAAAARAEADRLRAELTEAFSHGDTKTADRLAREATKADSVMAQPWAERIAGAQLAADRAKAAADAYATENYAALVAEDTPAGHARALALTEWITAGQAERAKWQEFHQVQIDLAHRAGHDSRAIPELGAHAELIRDLSRAGQVPAPLPQAHQPPPAVVPEHDPDPAIREPARAKARAESLVEVPVWSDGERVA